MKQANSENSDSPLHALVTKKVKYEGQGQKVNERSRSRLQGPKFWLQLEVTIPENIHMKQP